MRLFKSSKGHVHIISLIVVALILFGLYYANKYMDDPDVFAVNLRDVGERFHSWGEQLRELLLDR
jgi:hypothetical protein